ncbi:class I SAM-dependent methyltransferase [Nitrospira sp. Nam74]
MGTGADRMKLLNLRDYVSDEFDFGEFPHGALIVDIGCGTGKQLQLLELRGCAPIGIELDRNHVKRCGKDGLKVIQGVAEQMPLKQASCDGVICKVVIPYTNEAMSLQEIGRVLKPGGIGRICYHGAGYYLQYVLGAVPWKYRIYGVRALVNTWHYAMTGRRLPSFLGDTLYQSKGRLNEYYSRYGLELFREEKSREFLSFPVFIYHSIRKLRGR